VPAYLFIPQVFVTSGYVQPEQDSLRGMRPNQKKAGTNDRLANHRMGNKRLVICMLVLNLALSADYQHQHSFNELWRSIRRLSILASFFFCNFGFGIMEQWSEKPVFLTF
jgi:hypothetical protein